MALDLVTNPPSTLTDSSQWTDFVNREDKSNVGTGLSIPIFTLTNWDATTTIPAVANGSIIEVGGSIYQAGSETALTEEGGISDGTVHIKLVPSGSTVIPTLTNDVIPAWDSTKGGWYDSDDKFLPYEMTKASAVYTVKSEYTDQNKYVRFSVNSSGLAVEGNLAVSGALAVDVITEKEADTGVTVDGTLIKNGGVSLDGAFILKDIWMSFNTGSTTMSIALPVGTPGPNSIYTQRNSGTVLDARGREDLPWYYNQTAHSLNFSSVTPGVTYGVHMFYIENP